MRHRDLPALTCPVGRWLLFLLSAGALAAQSVTAQIVTNQMVAIEELGLRVAPGFRITLFSDENIANDIYAMTLDAQGRVVVTGHGYIKTLLDTDGDGRADQAQMFATPSTGGMGLCFDGHDLLFMGDGALWRYRDADGDARADGPPEKILPVRFGEHGGHAMRKGPDGWWCFIGGNDSQFGGQHITLPNSPIRLPEAGALLRLTPDLKQSEIIAHGLRNPYDFDFNALGDLFTYDSDVERDFFLPWYTFTRVYHVGQGLHHGWRLPGYMRSWNRPDYYVDVVDMLAVIGRGSPTGVTIYRHHQFPERYRNGLFICDWTFGKIFFCPLRPEGPTYRSEPELFLEPIGSHGFAPNDIVVARDGSLLISIGGRKTRGAVYRIESVVGAGRTGNASAGASAKTAEAPMETLEDILRAPQPLDAWSRVQWVPAAKQRGKEAFWNAAVNEKLPPADRIRAIEIATELFGGLSSARAAVLAKASSPHVRARAAWALGRASCDDLAFVLLPMAQDSHPVVRRAALEAVAERLPELDATEVAKLLPQNLAYREERVRQAAAKVGSALPDPVWAKLWPEVERAGPQARLSGAMATIWRNPLAESHAGALVTAVSILESTQDPRLRFQALRVIMLALGDWNLHKPSVETFAGYELTTSLEGKEAVANRVLQAVRAGFPSGEPILDVESSRLLAMLRDADGRSTEVAAAFLSESSSATADFHYLVVLSKLRGAPRTNLTPAIAHAILNLDRKLAGQEQRTKQNWSVRLAEVTRALVERDALVAEEILKHPDFARPGHIGLVQALGPDHRERAARLFLGVVRSDPRFLWSGALVELLSALPADEVRPLFRERWNQLGLRDNLVLALSSNPDPSDREKFLAGLESPQPNVVRTAISALRALPPDNRPETLVPLLWLLQRLFLEPKQADLRAETLALMARASGQSWRVQETGTDASALRRAYAPVFEWFAKQHPTMTRSLADNGEENPEEWRQRLSTVRWDSGNAQRGEAIYIARGCQTCHSGPNALGPDLRGVASRFSTEDLFNAILFPNREVAPPYRTSEFQTRDGQTYNAVVAFESADGVIIQTGATTTLRLDENEIVSRAPGKLSLMPSGLLAGLKAEELADLYAYLKSLEAARSPL
jgi:putative membrane-bound dehydrogenase-like protein